MPIERWEPINEMISLRDAMNSLFADSFVRPGTPPANGGAAMLPLDVAETDGEFVIKASLPGIKPEDVKITVHGDTLTIRGESKSEEEKKGTHWHVRERRVSSLARSLSLRAPIDADAAVAQFDHGVLTLTLPKTAQAQPKQIAVKTNQTPTAPAKSSVKEHAMAAEQSHTPGQKSKPSHAVEAEQTREAHENETARNATASSRERMVDIGRGNQQAGRQGQ